jgi:PPM family protein phosphatase
VELMSSGEFARASGLSRKALRLYDELGLLPPARTDPVSSYRFYAPAQLERARLVAWLRRLGMPLAGIRAVSTLPAERAAAELAAYWDTVEAETAKRRELATFLIGYLAGRETAVTDAEKALTIRYAVASETGLVRSGNEDAAYAGARLLAVADGMGGHAGGERASAAVIDALRPLDTQVPETEAISHILCTATDPDRAVRDLIALAIDAGGPDNVTCIVADVTG